METKEEVTERALILSPDGRLDFSEAKAFESTLSAAVDRAVAGGVGLIIDCAALEYVSSAGLRSFLVVARSATKRSLAFHICGLTTDVAEVFRVSGFEKIIPPLPDRAAAEAALSA